MQQEVINTCLRALGMMVPDSSLDDVVGLLPLSNSDMNKLARVNKAVHGVTQNELAQRKREFEEFTASLDVLLGEMRTRISAVISQYAGGIELKWDGSGSIIESGGYQRDLQFVSWNLRPVGGRSDASLVYLRADYGTENDGPGIHIELYARTRNEIRVLATFLQHSGNGYVDFVRSMRRDQYARWLYWPNENSSNETCDFISGSGTKCTDDKRAVVITNGWNPRDLLGTMTYTRGITNDVCGAISAIFENRREYILYVPTDYVRVPAGEGWGR